MSLRIVEKHPERANPSGTPYNFFPPIDGQFQSRFTHEVKHYEYMSSPGVILEKHHDDGLHILFAGCSVTNGLGLIYDEMWRNKLIKRLKDTHRIKNVSSIAMSGHAIVGQVLNIFEYIDQHGKPDIIMFNMPDMMRLVAVNPENNEYEITKLWIRKDEEVRDSFFATKTMFGALTAQLYEMLELMCKSHDIKLLSSSWDHNTTESLQHFKTFFSVTQDEMERGTQKAVEEHPDMECPLYARDGIHYGEAQNYFWADKFYEKLMEIIDE
jgi:hypothetical protein